VDPRLHRCGARAGKGRFRISFEHILPNLSGLLVVQGTIQFSLGVIAEAGPLLCGSWCAAADTQLGTDVERCSDPDRTAPRLALYPGFAVLLFVLGLNLLCDGLRSRRSNDPTTAIGRGFARVSIRGARITNDLSFQVGKGEIVGLVGASGSGKSMTALAIMQLLPAALD